jgi:PAS domain S-box-containing protein
MLLNEHALIDCESRIELRHVKSQLRTALLAFLVAVVCYAAATVGGTLVINTPQRLWPLWPGCAILVAILLILPPKTWTVFIPAGLAGFVVYDLQAGVSIGSIAWLLAADTAEIVVVAWGIRYSLKGVPFLNSLKSLTRYSFFAVVGSLLVSVIGIHGLNGNDWISWRVSFLSESLAFFTLTPAILGCICLARARLQRAYYVEAAVLITALFSLSYFVFVTRGSANVSTAAYSLVPFLIWSALRFGATGAGTAATIVALLSIWGAVNGRGPFTETDPIKNVLFLQLFLLFTAVPFMVLAVLVEERNRDDKILRESEDRFRLVANTAPVLIWMSGPDKLCTFFNQGWLNFTGRTVQEELGDGWTTGVHPDDREYCLRTYSDAFDARVDFQMEYRLRRFDGVYRWIVDFGVPRFETDGTFRGYIGTCIDITDRKSYEESVHNLTGRLISAQEEERNRIARELHDDFSQRLALVGIGLGQLWKRLPSTKSEERASVMQLLEGTKELCSDLHALSHQLHSSKLEHVGLGPALNGLCKDIAHKYKIEIRFTNEGCPADLPKDVALCLFRVAQEALGNVVKHSESNEAHVELRRGEGGLILRIVDHGRGFDPHLPTSTAGIGMIGMYERLRLVGGELLVNSKPNAGTEILAEVPLVSTNEALVKTQMAGR